MSEDAPVPDAARSPRLDALLVPVPGDSPVGGDVRYEDTYQELKGEVDEAQSPTGDADFGRVVALATKVLTEQSKDLTAACYLAVGLLRTEGLSGLGEGLVAVHLLAEAFWADLYPPVKRMAARKNALQFLADRAHEWLEAYRPTPSDAEALTEVKAAAEALEAFASEHMGEEGPVLSRLVQLAQTKQDAAQRAADKAASGTAAASEGEGAGEEEPGALRTPADAAAAVLSAAVFLREQDRTNPVPYRLARALRWSGLRVLPPNENGRTRLPTYIAQRKTHLDGLLGQAAFEKLVDDAEATFYDAPFWLDLQRYLHTAMEALGESFAAARDAVLAETALLLHRLPELPTLTFDTGAPFADDPTRLWVDTRVHPLFSGSNAPGGPAPDGEGDALEAQYAEARQLLAGGDLEAALARMAEGETSSEAGRDRFRRQLYVAALCRQGGRAAVARAVLEGLDAEVERAGVGAWEPALALHAWTALHECYMTLLRGADKSEQAALRQTAERLVEKVARLAPRRALALLDAK